MNNGKPRTYPSEERLSTIESELRSQKFLINKILEQLDQR